MRQVHEILRLHFEAKLQDAIYGAHVEDLFLAGFAGCPAGSKLAAIGPDAVLCGWITESRPCPGECSFVGLNGTPEAEVSLQGNDLGGNASFAATGSTYVHIPKGT